MNKTNQQIQKLVRYLVILNSLAVLGFWFFFQLSKLSVFSKVNPFAEDPVDAVGSIAVQIAFVSGILSLARLYNLENSASIERKISYVIRGCILSLSVICAALVADIATEIQQPLWKESDLGFFLFFFLIINILLASTGLIVSLRTYLKLRNRRIFNKFQDSQTNILLFEALVDLWKFCWKILFTIGRFLRIPDKYFIKVESLTGQILKSLHRKFYFVSPEKHPWRFSLGVGFFIGLILGTVHIFESGLPKNLLIALFLLLIFLAVEMSVFTMGYLTFGGFLGLRPPLTKH